MAINVICNNQPPQLAKGRCRTPNNNETIAVAKEQKRKGYLKGYMATRRTNNEFRNKQNRALQGNRSENNEKTRESQMRALNRRKESNSALIRELNRQAFPKSEKSNPHHV